MGDSVEIVEVSSRDGIQNEPKVLSTAQKLELIDRAVGAGVRRMEATSFVNPKRVPQMHDSEAIAESVAKRSDLAAIGLVLNAKGYHRAVSAGMREVNFVVVATDTFNQRNQGASTADTITAIKNTVGTPAERPVRLGISIAAAFGCPFEGEVPLTRVMEVVDAVMGVAPEEIALADTIGVATPRDVSERVSALRRAYPSVPARLHLHNTRGTGIANAWAGLDAGVSALDSSFGGVGGCPFAPRATGNIATEDLVYMLDRAGIKTGIDLDKAIETAAWLEEQLGIRAPGQVMRAGGFPIAQAA
ncbi:MAG: hydroxymethylglutaryl-CoA lyase [Pseudomonadota bacterium]